MVPDEITRKLLCDVEIQRDDFASGVFRLCFAAVVGQRNGTGCNLFGISAEHYIHPGTPIPLAYPRVQQYSSHAHTSGSEHAERHQAESDGPFNEYSDDEDIDEHSDDEDLVIDPADWGDLQL